MPSSRQPYLTAKLQGFGTTIFAEMSALAVATGSINLGQGFPDTDAPREVLDAAIAAINSELNQYPPGPGMPVLRHAIAAHQQRFYGLEYDADTEVLITCGATEALAGALLGLLDTGDEVVVFDPLFDSYAPCIAMAGAVPKPVPLRPPSYTFDADQLRAAVTPKTKLILLNTPHNPTGRVFSMEEMQIIADLAIERDLIVLTDEVYEHLTFDGARHIPMAALPGMRERTLSISSGGKTFNTTGWKVGWLCGPPPLVQAARTAKQFLTYVSSGPFQPAIAVGLALPDQFFHDVAADLQAKRDHLLPGLRAAGFDVYDTSATYFVTADIRPLRPDGDGMAFCRELPDRCGVVAIPNEVLYLDKAAGRHLVRFAFCKRIEVLDEAAQRLATLHR
ncbi:MAG: pyridoxal phosphate-dependent aminotransferase [Acidimicrobiaceae bacterium]|nr:pyridoxal phosphate-dependent aminotransferase [Acidimicrobiaceae bacterium]MCO5332152.1 pyridoxal phosphate-dependent aminotransferase [Ilumatobacteraceae bacterium]